MPRRTWLGWVCLCVVVISACGDDDGGAAGDAAAGDGGSGASDASQSGTGGGGAHDGGFDAHMNEVDAASDGSMTIDGSDLRDATTTDAASDAAAVDASDVIDAALDAADPMDAETDAALDDAGQSECVGGAASILSTGTAGYLLLRGTVVGPTQVFDGEVFIVNDTIVCVAASCAGAANVGMATVVDTQGVILPGLIDAYNHTQFDVFDASDWTPMQTYMNDGMWPNEARYHALVDAKQYLNGENPSPIDRGCELNKYAEMKALVAGTTSVVSLATPSNRVCYGSLTRTIDQSPNGFSDDKVQAASLLPATAPAADAICANFLDGDVDAYLVRAAAGTGMSALNEFNALYTRPTVDGCLMSRETSIAGGGALGDNELTMMGQLSMGLVWIPRSNAFMFGATHSANVPLAITRGVNVALGTDWSIGGSANMLDELRFADALDDALWGDELSTEQLVRMATINAARALGLEDVLGSLAVGKRADITVIHGDRCAPYDSVLAATPGDVRLTIVNGKVLYGDTNLITLGPAAPGCETLNVCSAQKFACVATASSSGTDKLAQTWVQIQSSLSTALGDYDALNVTEWDFSPLAPLTSCPQ